jgi:hypothetical protein
MKLYFIPVLLILCSCNGCPPNPTPTPSTPDCKAACTHLKDLKCEEGTDTPGKAPCLEVCMNMPVNQPYLNCVSAIKDCQQVSSCPMP